MPHRERAVPFVIEVFTHEPTVAVVRLRLGAQETRSVEQLRLETMLDSSFRHEVENSVSRPLPLVLLVGLEHGVRRRQQRLMRIRDPADPVEEIGEVIGLGKTGELRTYCAGARPPPSSRRPIKAGRKLLRARLRKADRRNARFRQVSLLRGNLAMQVACTWSPVAQIAHAQSRAADPRIPRAAVRQHPDLACSDIRPIAGAPARVRLAKGRSQLSAALGSFGQGLRSWELVLTINAGAIWRSL